MKKITRNALVFALMFGATVSFANDFGKKVIAKNEVEKNVTKFDTDPTFKRKGNKLFLNLLNLTQGKVILKVIDSEDRVVYAEEITGKLVVEKAFNFVKASEDRYTVVVVDNFGTYKRTVDVK